MSLGSVSGKRGGNEQHAAWITVGVWTSIFFDFVRLWLLEFDSCSGFLSVLVARQGGLYLGQQQLRQCSSRSICSAGCVVITLSDFSLFSHLVMCEQTPPNRKEESKLCVNLFTTFIANRSLIRMNQSNRCFSK